MVKRMAFFWVLSLLICQNTWADNANWMGEYAPFIQNKPLNQIFIPGTHDSGTYQLENEVGKGQDVSKDIGPLLKIPGIGKIFKNWAKCQSKTIDEQLIAGIRFLDFRIVYRDSKKDFYLVHGLYGKSLKQELETIANFLRTHPQEIVIIQASHMNYMPEGDQSHQKLISLIQSILGSFLAPASLSPQATVNQLWQARKQVILIYDANSKYAQSNPLLWPASTLDSYWANSTRPEDLKQKLDQHINNFFTTGRINNQFFVVQSQLTPDTQTIKAALNPFHKVPRSTKDLADKVKTYLPQWINEWVQKPVNIILHDFADEETASWIIQKNDPSKLTVPILYAPPASPSVQQKISNAANTVKQEAKKAGNTVKEGAKKAGNKIKHFFKS